MEYPEKIGQLTRVPDSQDWTCGVGSLKGIDIAYQTDGLLRAQDLLELAIRLPIDRDQKHGALIGGAPEIDESVTIFRLTETAYMTWTGYAADDEDWLLTTLEECAELADYIDGMLKGEF